MRVTKLDIIWNYLGTIMNLSSNLLLLPFMIIFLDSENLGLWYVFLSIGAIVILFDFGFNPTISRNVAYSWSGAKELTKTGVSFVSNNEPNIFLLKKIIYTCKRIYLLISLSALLILLTICTQYINIISVDIEGNTHIIAWIIYCIAVFLNLYFGYYTSLLRGVGAISQYNKAIIIARSIQIIASIILLLSGFGLVAVSLAYLAYGLLLRIFSKRYFYKYENIDSRLENENLVLDSKDIKNTFNIIWHNAWRDGLVSISSYFANQAPILLCSIFFSLTITGIYSITIQLIAAISSISGALYTSYQPSLQSAYISDNGEKLKKLMSIAMTTYCLVFWVGVILLLTIGIPLLNLISNEVLLSIPVLIAVAIYDFLLKHHSYYASYISNTNRVTYMKPFLVSSCTGIILSILLIQTTNIGIWSIILGQFIVQLLYNNWMWPYRVMKSLNTNPLEMFTQGMKEIFKLITPNKNKASTSSK